MSGGRLVELEGRRYAAGLMWLMPRDSVRGRRGWTLRQAREVGGTWYAAREHQVGFWTGDEPEGTERGIGALAHDVVSSIDVVGQESWQALVECTGALYVVVRGTGAEILPDGDVVFESRDEALEEFASEGDWGAVYATPGLVETARVLKVEMVEPGVVLVPVPFGRAAVRRRVALAALLAVFAGALVWGAREAMRLYEEWSRVEVVESRVRVVEEIIKEGVDVVGFLESCERGFRTLPGMPPTWEQTYLKCVAAAGDVVEVAGRLPAGVVLSRWRLKSGANPAVSRRIAAATVAQWDVGLVLLSKAWAGVGVSTSMRRWDGEQPNTGVFIEALDRRVGTLGDLKYRDTEQGFRAELKTRYPVSLVRERLKEVRWLQVVSLERDKEAWDFVLLRVEPKTVQREIVEEIKS